MLLLDAIATVESDNRPMAGDHGKALSRYQIHAEVWQDVHRQFGAAAGGGGVDVGTSFAAIGGADRDAEIRARNTASIHIGIIETFLQKHGQPTSAENIYACWNLGCQGFRRRQFNLAACPRLTITKAERVAELALTTKNAESSEKKT